MRNKNPKVKPTSVVLKCRRYFSAISPLLKHAIIFIQKIVLWQTTTLKSDGFQQVSVVTVGWSSLSTMYNCPAIREDSWGHPLVDPAQVISVAFIGTGPLCPTVKERNQSKNLLLSLEISPLKQPVDFISNFETFCSRCTHWPNTSKGPDPL